MRPPRGDSELARQIDELAARRKEVACERQRVVRVHAESFVRTDGADHSLENSKVEIVPVVRDEHVVTAELAEARPDFLEIRRARDVGVAQAVRLRRAGRDRDARPDDGLERLGDLSTAHTHGGDLHDLGLGRIVVGRLEVDRGEIAERLVQLVHLEQLRRLEHTEREPGLGALGGRDHFGALPAARRPVRRP